MAMHTGHRMRVKTRILENGTNGLLYHQLLEALLFFAIPYRDTNPVAHRIEAAFPRPDLLFSAEKEELTNISGVGEYTADFLVFCGDVYKHYVKCNSQKREKNTYSTIDEILVLFQEALSPLTEESVWLLLLNNRSEILYFKEVYKGKPSSAGFIPEHVLRPAILNRASFAVLGHNHLSDVAIPEKEDIEMTTQFYESMYRAGIPLLEHILIAGKQHSLIFGYSNQKKKETWHSEVHTEYAPVGKILPPDEMLAAEKRLLRQMLSYTGAAFSEEQQARLLSEFSLPMLLDSESSYIAGMFGNNSAVFFQLLHTLFTLKDESAFHKKGALSFAEAARLVAMLARGIERESVYLFLLDEKGALIDTLKVGEGVTNQAMFLPRRLLELALFGGAKKVLLAHTHPNGTATPSKYDMATTLSLLHAFHDVGIELVEHIVVTENEYIPIMKTRNMTLQSDEDFW